MVSHRTMSSQDDNLSGQKLFVFGGHFDWQRTWLSNKQLENKFIHINSGNYKQ